MLPEQEETGPKIDITGEPREELLPYLRLFADDAWEKDPQSNVQMIRFGRTVVLFKEDQIVDHIATLSPCTLLFMPEEYEEGDLNRLDEQLQQAIVLRSTDYAELEFDGELNFSRFPLPKMKGGRLYGPVTVASEMKELGPHDDLYLETEDVAFTDTPALTSIKTARDVRFRWGFNRGEGTMLRLDLAQTDPKNPKSPKILSHVQFETLKELNLYFPEDMELAKKSVAPKAPSPDPVAAPGGMKTASDATRTNEKETNLVPPLARTAPLAPMTRPGSVPTDPMPQTPARPPINVPMQLTLPTIPATQVDIRCRREFSFKADKEPDSWTADFHGQVVVTRSNPDKTQDQLTCEELRLNFLPKPAAAKKPAPKAALGKASQEDKLGSLEPVRFLALGKLARPGQKAVPARLTSPQSGGVVMEGDRILYDLKAELLALETEKADGASQEVHLLLQNRFRIRGEKGFQYTMGKDGAFGILKSFGKGSLRGNLGDEKTPKNVLLTWNAMQIMPAQDPTQILVELTRGALVEMETFGKMTSDTLQLWCVVEKGKDTESGASSPLPGVKGNEAVAGKGNIVPERAVALEKVHFENENGTGDFKRVDLFFEKIEPDGTVFRSRWLPEILTQEKPRPTGHGVIPEPSLPNGRESNGAVLTAGYAYAPSGSASPIRQVQHLAPIVAPAEQAKTPATGSPTVASQNLFGFQSGTTRSGYAITADQLKMKVKQDRGKSYVSHALLAGHVCVREKVADVSQGDLVEITGDTIQIWNPSFPDTVISVYGKQGREAIFRGKDIQMNAMEMNIYRAVNKFEVKGPGRLLTTPKAGTTFPVAGKTPPRTMPSQPQQDDPLLVQWNEEMSCDGKTVIFMGTPDLGGERVKALYRHQKVVTDLMILHLNRMVSFFDDRSNEPIEAEVLRCHGNVAVENRQYDEQNRLKSFDEAEFETFQIQLKTNMFVAKGSPGVLRSTFLNDGSGFSRTQSVLPGGAKPAVEQGELAFLGVWFYDDIQGYLAGNQKVANIRGRVRSVFCPVGGWGDKIEINRLSAASRRGYRLDCERLEIAQIPDPANPTVDMMEMTAFENAKIEGESSDFFGHAQTIKYNQAKSQIIFEGNAWIKSGQRELPAQRIEYNIKNGAFSVSRAQGFSAEGM